MSQYKSIIENNEVQLNELTKESETLRKETKNMEL